MFLGMEPAILLNAWKNKLFLSLFTFCSVGTLLDPETANVVTLISGSYLHLHEVAVSNLGHLDIILEFTVFKRN